MFSAPSCAALRTRRCAPRLHRRRRERLSKAWLEKQKTFAELSGRSPVKRATYDPAAIKMLLRDGVGAQEPSRRALMEETTGR